MDGKQDGGVKDLGDINNKFCLSITLKVDDNREEALFCFDNLVTKDSWLSHLEILSDDSLLTPYKPVVQPTATIKGTFGNLNKFSFQDVNGIASLGPMGNDVNNSKQESPDDGYWIVL